MASERQGLKSWDFWQSGPYHLTNSNSNWGNVDYRRSVMASLVKGMYTMEIDKKEGRRGDKSLAEPWWSFFHFTLMQTIVDEEADEESSQIGGVFHYHGPYRAKGAPNVVIAFRGTLPKKGNFVKDLLIDLQIVRNRLHSTARYKAAIESVRKYKGESPWLAGHSMGASIALMAGRQMVEEENSLLECHLFNPPFISPPFYRLRAERVIGKARVARNVVAAGITILRGEKVVCKNKNAFARLSLWKPHVYVHAKDDICQGFIGHFLSHDAMKLVGASDMAILSAQSSVSAFILSGLGERKAVHRIPSARLVISLMDAGSVGAESAHAVAQWWLPNLRVDSRLCTLGASASNQMDDEDDDD